MNLNKNSELNNALRNFKNCMIATGFAAGLLFAGQASAVNSFIETFDTDNSGWGDPTGSPGGAEHNQAGGFISTSGAFGEIGQGVLFRGNGPAGASGNAFSGNWIADGVTQFSVDVRHNSAVPLNFFARFASPFNFPGATAVKFAPVLGNQWTTLTFDIAPNPQFGAPNFVTFEGSDFATVFGNLGRVQVGVSEPDGWENNPALGGTFTFDLDNASITVVPEPSGTLLAMVGGMLVMLRRNRGRKS